MGEERFPLFVDLRGKKAVVIGAGHIAQRRIGVLRDFGAKITVIAPEGPVFPDDITFIQRKYRHGDLSDAFIAVTAANDRSVNHLVCQEAAERGILISVADSKDESSFYFPAICRGSGLVAGVVSDGKEHYKTAQGAKAIRKVLEDMKE